MKKGKLLKRLLICLLLMVCIIGCGVFAGNLYLDSMLDKLDKGNTYTAEQINVFNFSEEAKKKQKITNIALLAIDGDDEVTTRTDVMKIVSVNETKHTLAITSLQRDFIVYHPMQDMYEKLNHAFYYDGVEGTLNTINYNFDLDVSKYLLFSFESIADVVDTVGGLDIELTQAEINQNVRDIGVYGSAGTYHLEGWQVVQYCRIRTIDNDYQRMKRQNNVINAIINKIKTKNVGEILEIVSKVLPLIKTNLTNDEIKSYIVNIFKYDINNIPQYQYVSDLNSIKGNITWHGYNYSVVLHDWSKEVIQLHKNIYGEDTNYTPSENVMKTTRDTLEIYDY